MTRKFHCLAMSLLLAGCGVATAPAPDNGQAPRSEPSAAAPEEAAPSGPSRAALEEAAADPDASTSQPGQAPNRRSEAQTQVSACLVQDGQRIAENALHAVGTEPFWAADVKGRCVTYSHPENIDGTRVWTEFSGTAESGTWSGYLGDRRFVMRTRPKPGCSDGMSDKSYPIAVTLTVRGEARRGCAERR